MADIFDIHYGSPGTAKTRSILELIKQENAKTGKKARVYVGDGSKIMYTNSPLYKAGLIDLVQFDIRDSPFTTCQMLCDGYWPEDVNDPNSKFKRLTPDQVVSTGVWVIEGASVMGNYMMGTKKGGLAQRAASGETLGQEANVRFADTALAGQDALQFGGNAGAHYNIAQRYLLSNIIRTKSFPGIVIWTAHERIDDGERGGSFAKGQQAEKVRIDEKTIGPELVGKAMTGWISREFGNTLHYMLATKKTADGTDPATGKTLYKEKTEYRIYTRDHYDPDGIVGLKYRAVMRANDPSKVSDYYVSTTPGEGLIKFYADVEKGNA